MLWFSICIVVKQFWNPTSTLSIMLEVHSTPFRFLSHIRQTILIFWPRSNHPKSSMTSKDHGGAYNISVHIMSIDTKIWNVVKPINIFPIMIIDGIELDKSEKQWANVETKKVQYDLKASNILLSTLSLDKYFFSL